MLKRWHPKKLGLLKSGSFPPRQQLTFQRQLSTVIFPSSLIIKAQGRALGRVFSGGPAHAGFNDCSHLTCEDSGSHRQSGVPEIPQSLTKTLAPEHVSVFGGWDEVRSEPSTHPRATAFCLLVYFLKKKKLTLFIFWSTVENVLGIHKETQIYIHRFIYIYLQILFHYRFYKILNIVLCALQKDLVYFIYSNYFFPDRGMDHVPA